MLSLEEFAELVNNIPTKLPDITPYLNNIETELNICLDWNRHLLYEIFADGIEKTTQYESVLRKAKYELQCIVNDPKYCWDGFFELVDTELPIIQKNYKLSWNAINAITQSFLRIRAQMKENVI